MVLCLAKGEVLSLQTRALTRNQGTIYSALVSRQRIKPSHELVQPQRYRVSTQYCLGATTGVGYGALPPKGLGLDALGRALAPPKAGRHVKRSSYSTRVRAHLGKRKQSPLRFF